MSQLKNRNEQILKEWCSMDIKNKTALGRKYNVSARTVGRIVAGVSNPDEGEEKEGIDWDYCVSKNEVTVLRNGEARTITNTFPKFSNIKADILSKGNDDSLQDVYDNMCMKKVIDTFSEGNLTVDYENSRILYGTFEVKNSLVTHIFNMLEEGHDVLPMVRFLSKLMDNPDKGIIEQLYPFMEHNSIKISEEGNIIAYRKVSDDYKDLHTGSMDNSVGATVKMPRARVDCNPNNTCSSGIHAASVEYASGFGSGRLMLCEINPRDVCSVPVDYDFMKMRVCELVIKEELNK